MVKKLLLEEIERMRSAPPTEEEVADAKNYLLATIPFRLVTNENLADQLLMVERHGLGFDYLATYRKAIEAVTPADVQAVAKKYLRPEKMTLVAAGPIDKHGKPLKKEK